MEIGPGYGRWTGFLRQHCEQLVGLDISQDCIEACRRRFRRDRRLSFHVNDGKTLTAVDDGTADLVFSFDSLVHVEQDVLNDYLREIARVLTENGVAFIHHSNMAENMARLENGETPHWRATSVSAESVSAAAAETGLSCFRQELIPWGRRHDFLIDCMTWVARPDSLHDAPVEVVRNLEFMDEADAALARSARRRRYRPKNLARGLARRARRALHVGVRQAPPPPR